MKALFTLAALVMVSGTAHAFEIQVKGAEASKLYSALRAQERQVADDQILKAAEVVCIETIIPGTTDRIKGDEAVKCVIKNR